MEDNEEDYLSQGFILYDKIIRWSTLVSTVGFGIILFNTGGHWTLLPIGILSLILWNVINRNEEYIFKRRDWYRNRRISQENIFTFDADC